MTTVTVYCGSSNGKQPVYQQATHQLGQWLAAQQFELVYGGSQNGLMKTLADVALAGGCHVTGVMPRFMLDQVSVHPGLTEVIYVDTMHERKAKMLELGDAYLALPGGPGTLEEISEVMSWVKIGQLTGPCIFWNVAGYYDLLQQFLQQMVTTGFLSAKDYQRYHFINSLTELGQLLGVSSAAQSDRT